MVKILLDSAVANNFSDSLLINLVEFSIFVLLFLIAVFISYMIYRSKNKR